MKTKARSNKDKIMDYCNRLIVCADDGTFPSINSRGSCRYRGPNNTKCAIGIIIPDEMYNAKLERKGVHGIFDVEEELAAYLLDQTGLNQSQLKLVQRLHDVNAKADGGWNAGIFKTLISATFTHFAEQVNE